MNRDALDGHRSGVYPHRLDRLTVATVQQCLAGRLSKSRVVAPHDGYQPLNGLLAVLPRQLTHLKIHLWPATLVARLSWLDAIAVTYCFQLLPM